MLRGILSKWGIEGLEEGSTSDLGSVGGGPPSRVSTTVGRNDWSYKNLWFLFPSFGS